jgi:hypothetical protein
MAAAPVAQMKRTDDAAMKSEVNQRLRAPRGTRNMLSQWNFRTRTLNQSGAQYLVDELRTAPASGASCLAGPLSPVGKNRVMPGKQASDREGAQPMTKAT